MVDDNIDAKHKLSICGQEAYAWHLTIEISLIVVYYIEYRLFTLEVSPLEKGGNIRFS